MQQPLPKALPLFDNASVLVIGDIMLDRYWFGDTSRISPEAPVPVVKIAAKDDRPGGAANVALNIAALGANVTLLGVTGNDEPANALAEQLTAANVKHDFYQLNNKETIVKLRIISRHQQLLRLDFEEETLQFEQEQLLAHYKKHLPDANLVILSDYRKGTLKNPQQFIELAKAAGIPVLVDPKGSDFSIYHGASLITPNLKEFEMIVGHCPHEQDIIGRGRHLINQYGLEALLVTRGEYGMTLIQQQTITHLPAYARDVFDVTGAGDTVIGVLGATLATGENLLHATALANLAASITVSKLGAATVSTPELEAALSGKTSFASGIVNEEQLALAVNEARAQGKRIVFTNGCFDILHAGHVTYLQLAKQLGDYLIVAVNTDESIRTLKGPHRPINNLEHRMTVLAGLGVVDWVVPFADETPRRLLQLLKPELLVKGGDYRLDQIVGADIVRAYGGEVRVMNSSVNTSSTAIINQIKSTQHDGDHSHG